MDSPAFYLLLRLKGKLARACCVQRHREAVSHLRVQVAVCGCKMIFAGGGDSQGSAGSLTGIHSIAAVSDAGEAVTLILMGVFLTTITRKVKNPTPFEIL